MKNKDMILIGLGAASLYLMWKQTQQQAPGVVTSTVKPPVIAPPVGSGSDPIVKPFSGSHIIPVRNIAGHRQTIIRNGYGEFRRVASMVA